MLYRICNGLVAITASAYLQLATVHTRRSETRYRQIQCNTNTYSNGLVAIPSFLLQFACEIPIDVCQLPPDSFKAQLNSVQLM